MKWPYFLLAGVVILLLGFGLNNVIKEDVVVAPWAKTASEGRLGHTKNVTRILQSDREALHRYLQIVIIYEGVGVAEQSPSESNWKHFLRESILMNPQARYVLLLPALGGKALAWSLPVLWEAMITDLVVKAGCP